MPELSDAAASTRSSPASPSKKVSWAELFFDLVFVFGVTEVSALLRVDHSLAGIGRALIVFVPIYWVWVGTSMQANVNDRSSASGRLSIFATALGGLFMALAVVDAYGDRAVLFALSYWGCRLMLGIGMFSGRRVPINPVTISMFVSGPLLVLGAGVGGTFRIVIWAVVTVLELSTPTLLRRRLSRMHFDAGHLTERFGLFVLIALGESVVAIGAPVAGAEDLHTDVLLGVTAAFALSCALWWVYFHFAADAMRHALETAQVQLDVTRHVLSYGHLAFIGSIIAMSVGMRETILHPSDPMAPGVVGLLYGGCALYLATFGYTRWMMFRLVSSTRLTAAAAVLVVTPVAPHVSALVALVLLAATVTVLNVVEYLRERRRRLSPVVAEPGGRTSASPKKAT